MADSSDKENEAAPPRYRGINDKRPDAKEKKRKRRSLKKVVLGTYLLKIQQLIDSLFFFFPPSRPSKPTRSSYPNNASLSSNRTASSKNSVEPVLPTVLQNLTQTAQETMRLSRRKGRKARLIMVPLKQMLCRPENDMQFVTNCGLTLRQFGTWSMSRRPARTQNCYQMDRKTDRKR